MWRSTFLLAAAVTWTAPCSAQDRQVREGVVVEFSARPAPGATASELMEGEFAEVRFKLTDEASGQPLRGNAPGAWMDIGHVIQPQEGGTQKSCKEKVQLYLRGIVGIRPMLDLNSYYVVVLNHDASVSVIDPLVSVAGVTSTLARIQLPKPGADWARSANGKRLYVSMPTAGQVAVIDTDTFKLIDSVSAGRNPTRVVLQPDGRYLWIGNNTQRPGESGVTVIDTETLKTVKSFPTGLGHHEIALSEDGRRAFVTNRDSATLTVVDVRELKALRAHEIGGVPISVAYSPLSKAVYVADARGGAVHVLAGADFEPAKRIALKAGLGPMRFTPDGRYGLLVNPSEDLVHVIDVSSNERIHDIAVKGQPYQLAFTRAFGYVRSLSSERVTMINLSTLDRGSKPIVQSFAAGAVPPKAAGDLPLADSIAPAIGEAAVLVVNPGDNTTYFYMEGMNAPMSNYKSLGAAARAVTVVDRSLKEIEPGLYASKVRIPAAGRYDVALLLDSPRIIHCFSTQAQANPALATAHGRAVAEFLLDEDQRAVAVGATVPVRVRLKDRETGVAKTGLKDVRVLSFLAPGQRRSEVIAKEVEPGVYEAPVSIPEHGAYSVRVASKALQKDYHDFTFITLHTARPDLEAELKRRMAGDAP
jgi:YVTN family beta-propeller protein